MVIADIYVLLPLSLLTELRRPVFSTDSLTSRPPSHGRLVWESQPWLHELIRILVRVLESIGAQSFVSFSIRAAQSLRTDIGEHGALLGQGLLKSRIVHRFGEGYFELGDILRRRSRWDQQAIPIVSAHPGQASLCHRRHRGEQG